MPSPRVLDLSPLENPLGASIGQGFGNYFQGLLNKQKEAEQQTNIDNLLASIEEGQSEEDVTKAVFGAKGVPFEVKQKIHQNILQDRERTQKRKEGDATRRYLAQQQGLEPEELENVDIPTAVKLSQQKTQTLSDRQKLLEAGATPEQMALWDAAPIGGKTAITQNILDAVARKQPSEYTSTDLKDYDKGLTPKERVKRQDDRFRIQTPIVNENSKALDALSGEGLSLDLLKELNDTKKVGAGLSKLNINPKTGELFVPEFASPEEQLFVKTINDFTVKAKDSFGARVTNFELDRFMQRLPTMANSIEGRALILRQMSIVNKLNQLEKKAIQDVFDDYGVRNIDYAEAEKIARSNIKDEKESLKKEYLDLEQIAKKEESELKKNIEDRVKPGYTALRTPDGSIKQFPTKNVQSLLDKNKGYKRL